MGPVIEFSKTNKIQDATVREVPWSSDHSHSVMLQKIACSNPGLGKLEKSVNPPVNG